MIVQSHYADDAEQVRKFIQANAETLTAQSVSRLPADQMLSLEVEFCAEIKNVVSVIVEICASCTIISMCALRSVPGFGISHPAVARLHSLES